jgi:hypothetical protein
VLLVCIAVFLGFGQNLQALLSSLKSDMAQHAQQAQMTQIEVANAKLSSEEDDSIPDNLNLNWGSLRANSANPNALCGKDFCVDAPGLIGTSVSTAGSNGSTSIISSASNIFSQLAKILAEKGADANTVNLLTKLASEGHIIADMHDWLNYDGHQRANRARTQIVTTNQYMKSESKSLRNALATFQQLSQQMDSSIGDYPEEVRPLLTNAAKVVLVAGSSYAMWQTKNKAGQRVIRFQADPTNVQLIHTNSNTICDNGGDQTKCHQN